MASNHDPNKQTQGERIMKMLVQAHDDDLRRMAEDDWLNGEAEAMKRKAVVSARLAIVLSIIGFVAGALSLALTLARGL